MKTEVIIVTSGKGGTGKTTFTANLAYSLAKEGRKTCIIDLDFICGKLDLILGLESKVEYDISHIIHNKKSTLKVLVKDKKVDNLFLLPSPKQNEDITLTYENLKTILENLKLDNFDFILIDCPKHSNQNNLLSISAQLSNKAIVIANPEKPSLRDVDSAISILENNIYNHKENIFLIINKYIEPKLIPKKGLLKSKEIQRALDIPLLGTISYNTKNVLALNQNIPIINLSNKASNEYKYITKELFNQLSKKERENF